ncbi:cation transporter [Salinicola sp. V024]|uniref:cation transporter n=1 Tax=Salinicola TaxID=404432 RepID=UPI00094E27C6|nr:cation diffusion facilitator family transporter [Salinicola sp. MH3R3-1]OLO08639.1 cation diffusion facilitator family transporter [Salinicola sp. MH3R3-1]
MDSCCENKAGELAQLRGAQAKVLYWVLGINGSMFVIEFVAGWLIGSTALLADSLDMFGDATVYILTLYALNRSDRTRAGAALVKSLFMFVFGLAVIAEAVHKSVVGSVPEAGAMGIMGLLALAANTVCFIMLLRYRSADLNMRSTWLCSRNDLIANTSVVLAAVAVGMTGTVWPDVVVGLAIAALFLHSAWQVSTEAIVEWRVTGQAKADASSPPSETVSTGNCCESKSSCCD